MRALVLERQHELALRDIDLPLKPGPGEVRIKIHTVGVCGSDVHYYTHGRIGPFVVNAPMVLGHEAAGTVVEVGAGGDANLKVGDRVCMEPGIPDPNSRASRLGLYNVDPAVTLLGDAADPRRADARSSCIRRTTPSSCPTMSASPKARWSSRSPSACRPRPRRGSRRAIRPSSSAPGRSAPWWRSPRSPAAAPRRSSPTSRSRSSTSPPAIRASIPVNIREKNLVAEVSALTDGWGADVVFECSGSPKAWETIFDLPRPGGASSWSACRSSRSRFDIVRPRPRKSASRPCSATPTSTTARSR